MFDKVWDDIFLENDWGRYPSEHLIRFIAQNYYNKEKDIIKILELGCGPGPNLWYLAREGISFLGIDGSKEAVLKAKMRLSDEFPEWNKSSDIIVGDLQDFDFGVNKYDAVIDNECIYCVDLVRARDIYRRAHKSLKENGKIFVRTFTPETFGFKTGEKVDELTYYCDVGPLAGKGMSRFTTEGQIPFLFKEFSSINVNKTITTYSDANYPVSEWLITCSK